MVVDPGYIGQRISAQSWCEYTLVPFLAQTYGTTTIDHFIIMQPNKLIFNAVIRLQQKIIIKNLYIVVWQRQMPPHWLHAFMQLKKICAEKGCILHRIAHQKTITMHDVSIALTPLADTIEHQTFSYPVLFLQAIVDNETIDLYSAKHNKDSLKKDTNAAQNIISSST